MSSLCVLACDADPQPAELDVTELEVVEPMSGVALANVDVLAPPRPELEPSGFNPLPPIPPTAPGQPACAINLQRPAQLSFHMLQGECVEGLCSFDYDPVGEVETQISGSYSQLSGDFEWSVTYHPDHWRASTTVSGNAAIDEEGSETSSFTRTTVDVGGTEHVEQVQLWRTNCLLQVLTFRNDQGLLFEGQFGEQLDFLREQYTPIGSGTWLGLAFGSYDAGVWDVSMEVPASDDPFWWGMQISEHTTAGGDRYLDFYQWSPLLERSRAGFCLEDITGAVVCEADVDDAGVSGFAAWWYDDAGDGAGMFDQGFDSCELSFSEGSCSRACTLSGVGGCEPFLFDES